MTEMVCVSAPAGSRPAAPGLWTDEQAAAWRRITDFVHAGAPRRSASSSGHSGRKGSTKLMWEGIDEPLDDGQLGGRRARRRCPTGPASTRCRASSRSPSWRDHAAVRRRRATGRRGRLRPARAALRARLPAVVVHLAADQPAHRRVRRHLADRLRYPLEVFDAMRAVWPDEQADDRPHLGDRLGRGRASPATTSVEIARAFHDAGADAIDVSTGQVTPDERPASAGPTRRRTRTRSATRSASRRSRSASSPRTTT